MFAVVFLCPPFLKKYLLKWFCGARIGHGASIGWFSSVMGKHIAIGDHAEIRPLTLIRCAGDVRVGKYATISSFVLIYGSAAFTLGDHAYIGPQSLINVDEAVRIGSRSALGPRCMLFTHGSFLPYTEGYWVKFGPITIGDNVWCAAGVFIHPGIAVGDNVFVNSRSVLAQDVPSGAVMEGFPAQQVTTIDKIRRTMTPRRVDAALQHMLRHFAETILQQEMGIAIGEAGTRRLSFSYRGRDYLILCVPADGAVPSAHDLSCDKQLIMLVNRPAWTPPAPLKHPMVFDFTTMRTRPWRDKVHTELCLFMKRYYGVQFEYQ